MKSDPYLEYPPEHSLWILTPHLLGRRPLSPFSPPPFARRSTALCVIIAFSNTNPRALPAAISYLFRIHTNSHWDPFASVGLASAPRLLRSLQRGRNGPPEWALKKLRNGFSMLPAKVGTRRLWLLECINYGPDSCSHILTGSNPKKAAHFALTCT